MALQNNDLRNYLPKNMKVSNWKQLKEKENGVYEQVMDIISASARISCELQCIPLLDEEDVNIYDEEIVELYEEVLEQLIKDNENLL